MQPDVVIVDYGVGNLLSVRRGLEQCGAQASVSGDPEQILRAPRVVLPGVGAFGDGMSQLRQRGLHEVLREVARRGRPLLGICLGMQMLFDKSEEFGTTEEGLGIIPGKVVAVPCVDRDGQFQKVPHIGWNSLSVSPGRDGWAGTILEPVRQGEDVYFVHSYMAMPVQQEWRVADCDYGGIAIAAVAQKESVSGCQFHPEKSGAVGLSILGAFLRQ